MDPLPIACALTPPAFADRAQAWRTLLSAGLVSRERRPDGVRLLVTPGVERTLRGLLALEAECCAWFSSTVIPGDPVVVDLTSAGEGPAVLEAMIDAAIAGS
ncbi:MAG: hypothetical protein JWL78_1514 [Chloroflexi bacterium]|jgi:hypothetical protein|nr:hypothetical protein [Chloroflexota bacterium]